MTKFSSHYALLSSSSKKFILWKIAIIISIVRTQKTMGKEVNINIRRKEGKSLKQQQENVLRRTKKHDEVFPLIMHTRFAGFTTEFSSDIFKDFAFKGLAFSSLSFEISLTTTWGGKNWMEAPKMKFKHFLMPFTHVSEWK